MLQGALKVIYPARCLLCQALTEMDFGLCGACWRDTPFIDGLVCNSCGAPLPGDTDGADPQDCCDDCMVIDRPWAAGRAALLYRDNGRRIVLKIKHSNRTDLTRAAAIWLARAAAPLVTAETLVVPVPLHWTRLLSRTYNQAADLARGLGRETGLPVCPDALVRKRRTAILAGMGAEARFETLDEAIAPHPKRGTQMRGRPVLIVDDVMTSGATASAAADAARRAGATTISLLHLARATKGD